MNHVTVSSSPAKVTLHYGQPIKVTLRYDQKGERGIGISSVALDEQAHLIVTYDDGKTQDAGAALGDVASVKDGIDSSYRKIQTSEANVTKLESSTRTNAEKAQQALQDTQSASASGVNNINTLTTEKMTYMTNTFNSLLIRAKANIDQWERDAEDKIHTERTYSLEQIKTAHDDAMVDIERSVNKAESWAVSETTPDREPDFESPTGLTQSSRSWALYSKKKVQESYDILKNIHDNEKNVANMKNDVNELLRRAQASEANAKASETNAENSASAAVQSATSAKASETNAKSSETAAKASETNAKTSETNAASYATSANDSKDKASEYKTSASDSATAAASLASSASESATNARAAMNTANTAASSASTSATNASTSASNASKSEIAAKTAQAAAEKARDDANSAVNKLTGAMKYAGQVDNYSDLVDVTKNRGDVWNIVNADTVNGIKAGDNVAWNGTDWDNLSGVVDLSAYAEKVDYQKAITSATANGATITFNHKDGTTSTATVNNVASATAAKNDAKGQKIDTTYEKIADASNVHTSLQNSINSLSTGKQDKLTFDKAPTANSSNPVTSGGIKTALDTKLDKTGTASAATQDGAGNNIADTYATKSSLSSYQTKLTFDSTPTANSSNPVTSGGIKTALDTKLDKTGTAVSASKLKTARTISLTGNATGSTSFDGSGNVSINTTVNESKHAVLADTLKSSSATETSTVARPVWLSLEGDNTKQVVSPNLTYTCSTKTLTATNFKGHLAGNSDSATKLSTARTVQTNLASTSSASFDGSANITPGVSGILPVANGGTGSNSLNNITVGRATSDASGNNISSTYVKKTGDTITGPILYEKTPNDDSELINKAYADKLASAADTALNEKSSTLYNQLYLPRYNLYIRSALPASTKTSITINPMALTINGSTYELKDAETFSLNSSSSWDSATYATASNRAGKDFYIYACQPSSGTVPTLILSANGTVPTGYTATNSRKIGGFHCECLNVGTVTDKNPMNGYATGDIIPYSIWDLKHRPKSSPEGMVYVEPLNMWISIYLMSWDGSKLVSAYNGVQADGASAKPFSGTEFAEYLAKVNMRLPRYDEFVVFAKGIQECVNVKGSYDVNTTGGHYTTDNKRIVSNYGIEDCTGVVWQWLSDVFGSDFANSWNTSSNRDARNTRGDSWGGGLRRALAGGYWDDGAYWGSRASAVGCWSAFAGGDAACRGASEPLIHDY